jgi:hypothetical protein
MRRITRVLLALVLAPAALLVLWLVVWGGVFLSGTLNGAYALPVDEPNRLFIVLPEERPGSLLFLAYGCVGGQRRVLQDNTWTVSFNRRGLACTTVAPFVIKGGAPRDGAVPRCRRDAYGCAFLRGRTAHRAL